MHFVKQDLSSPPALSVSSRVNDIAGPVAELTASGEAEQDTRPLRDRPTHGGKSDSGKHASLNHVSLLALSHLNETRRAQCVPLPTGEERKYIVSGNRT